MNKREQVIGTNNNLEIIKIIDPLEHGSYIRGIGKYKNEIVYFNIAEYGHFVREEEYTEEMRDIIKSYLDVNGFPGYCKYIFVKGSFSAVAEKDKINKYYTITDLTGHPDDKDIKLKTHIYKVNPDASGLTSSSLFNIYKVNPDASGLTSSKLDILEEIQKYAYGFYDEDRNYYRNDSDQGIKLLDEYIKNGKYSDMIIWDNIDFFNNLPLDTFEILSNFSFDSNHKVWL